VGSRVIVEPSTTNQQGADMKTTKNTFEAYGVKGVKSTPWRKTFKSQEAFEKWLDAQDGNVEVFGFCDL
jgi:hypothetical protein